MQLLNALNLFSAIVVGTGAVACLIPAQGIASSLGKINIGSGHVRIDASDASDYYNVESGGWLESNGATMINILALVGRLTLENGSTVLDGLKSGGYLDLINSSVYGDTEVAVVLQDGAVGNLIGSTVSGGGLGVSATTRSTVNIINSSVSASRVNSVGDGWGVGVFGGNANILEKSRISGLQNGILMFPGRSPGDSQQYPNGTVVIDNSTVSSDIGAAIKIKGLAASPGLSQVFIKNDSTLNPGNGVLVEIENANATVVIDNSRLEGSLTADEYSALDVILSNSSLLTGDIINARTLSLVSNSQWSMLNDNSLQNLTLDSSTVHFAGVDFSVLSLNELSGIGTFDMRINLDTAQGDLLNVTGQATGHHQLNVQNTGVEAVKPEFEPLRIVHTEGGDAQFGLIGGRVDLGAYSYLLEKQDNDWFIVGEGKVISPSTQSALALFNAAPAIWNSELTTLRSRMGEVRGQEEGGGWIRSYGNRFNAGTGAGMHYQQKQQGLSFGADAPIPVSNGSLVLGVMGGYSKSDLDLSRGTSGEVNSYYAGVYGTWLLDDGYYLDGVLKLNKFRNESEVAMSDGTKAKGRYNNAALGGSVEFGRHIKLSDDYFVEPYAQLSSVFIGGDSYRLSNGLKAKNDRTQSVLGKVGTTAGRDFTLKDGSVLQPYVRVALAHEFAHDNEVKVNETRFDNSLSGSRLELGAGVAVSLSKRVQLHADFDYMKGEHVEQPWGANVGLKLAF